MTIAPNANQIAGAMLEEAVLSLLGAAGFRPLESLQGDATIDPAGPPVTIRGRGTSHQIDAVADPLVGYAFSNPARLLVEAKAYSQHRRVGLDVVRNAVGTLKDLSEFWRPTGPGVGGSRRYHYRYAIFASTEFTAGAQEYAFAQDVYLLPLRRCAFFRPVLEAIEGLRAVVDGPDGESPDVTVADNRRALREALHVGRAPEGFERLQTLVAAVQQIRYGLIAVADRTFPIFLVPGSPRVIQDLDEVEHVCIYWDEESWYLRRTDSDENLFSFDLPRDLLALYADSGNLQPQDAIRLKAERLSSLQALVVQQDRVRVVQFQLDEGWIQDLLREGQQRGTDV